MGRQCSLSPAEVDVSRCRSLLALVPTAAAWLGATTAGCGGHATPEDCAKLCDHYVDLAVAESPGGAKLPAAQAAAIRDVERGLKRAEPTYRRVQDRCDSVTRSEVRCARGASTTAEWEACLRGAHADAGE
jgi:hypothetical protein